MHHLSVAFWISISSSITAVVIAIVAGIRRSKYPPTKNFDFAASARRIRNMPISPRDDA